MNASVSELSVTGVTASSSVFWYLPLPLRGSPSLHPSTNPSAPFADRHTPYSLFVTSYSTLDTRNLTATRFINPTNLLTRNEKTTAIQSWPIIGFYAAPLPLPCTLRLHIQMGASSGAVLQEPHKN